MLKANPMDCANRLGTPAVGWKEMFSLGTKNLLTKMAKGSKEGPARNRAKNP